MVPTRARFVLASSAVLLTAMLTARASARPAQAPPVQAVAAALGVERFTPVELTPEERRIAEAAGHRLISLCPDCRLATLTEEGPCGWARAQRDVLRRAAAKGMSEDAIVETYVETYGAQILAIDKRRGVASASWSVPIVVIVLSLAGLLVLGYRRTRTPVLATTEPAPPAVSPELQDKLRDELDALD